MHILSYLYIYIFYTHTLTCVLSEECVFSLLPMLRLGLMKNRASARVICKVLSIMNSHKWTNLYIELYLCSFLFYTYTYLTNNIYTHL